MNANTREKRVNQIVVSLEKKKADSTLHEIDFELLVTEIQKRYFTSRRTAMEYANLALSCVGFDKNKLNNLNVALTQDNGLTPEQMEYMTEELIND